VSEHVAVVGAGVFGAWTATHLQRAGHRVTLVDAHGPAHSRASSGGESRLIRAAYGRDTIYTRMARDSLPEWQALSAASGLPIFHPCGILFFFGEEEAYVRDTIAAHQEAGLATKVLTQAEMAERFSAIDFERIELGVYEPGFGVLMAYESDRLGVLAARLSAQAWIGILVTACLLLSLQWMVLPFGVQPGSVFGDLWMTYTAAGATLLVFTAAFCGPVRRLLERRPIQLLGLLSFSLYLVQEPVTIRFALATHASLPLWLALPIELTLALVVAVLFYRAVERPAHRLARRVGAVPVGRHSVPAIDRTGPVSAPRVGSP